MRRKAQKMAPIGAVRAFRLSFAVQSCMLVSLALPMLALSATPADTIHDVGVVKLTRPHLGEDTLPFSPVAKVKNFGRVPESFWVYMHLYYIESTQYLDSTKVENLAAGAPRTVEFPIWGGQHVEGQYVAYCYTAVPVDSNPANDTMRGIFTIPDMRLPRWQSDFRRTTT